MKKHTHLYPLLIGLLSLVLLLASCGASSKLESDAPEDVNQKNELYDAEVVPGIGATGTTDTSQSQTDDRKIVKTFDLSAEAKDFTAAIDSLNRMIELHEGYVESSSSSDKSLKNSSDSYTRHASYTIRIPAEHAEAFVGSMKGVLNVTNSSSSVEDISETYYSIEARLEELQAERDSLLAILNGEKAQKDYQLWLTVMQRLSEVRQQIAVYQGQINRYDSQVAYSTVNLSIREVLAYSATGNDFGSRLKSAFADGWNGFVIGLGNFTIWLAEALPTLILLGGIATGVVFLIRGLRRKKKNRLDQTDNR